MSKEQVREALNLFEQGLAVPDKAVLTAIRECCDLCPNPISLVDGKTITGIWANMCTICFSKYGIGIGLGKGQVLIWKGGI